MGGKLAEPINKEVDLGIALFVKTALKSEERYYLGITDREREGRLVLRTLTHTPIHLNHLGIF